jgi:hypothetical protein
MSRRALPGSALVLCVAIIALALIAAIGIYSSVMLFTVPIQPAP